LEKLERGVERSSIPHPLQRTQRVGHPELCRFVREPIRGSLHFASQKRYAPVEMTNVFGVQKRTTATAKAMAANFFAARWVF